MSDDEIIRLIMAASYAALGYAVIAVFWLFMFLFETVSPSPIRNDRSGWSRAFRYKRWYSFVLALGFFAWPLVWLLARRLERDPFFMESVTCVAYCFRRNEHGGYLDASEAIRRAKHR